MSCRSPPSEDLWRDLIAPLCQAGGGGDLLELVVVEVAVDDFGELSLEAAQCFGGGLVFGLFAQVVRAAGSGVHGLDARGQVQGVVEGAVAALESRWRRCSPLETSIGAVPV